MHRTGTYRRKDRVTGTGRIRAAVRAARVGGRSEGHDREQAARIWPVDDLLLEARRNTTWWPPPTTSVGEQTRFPGDIDADRSGVGVRWSRWCPALGRTELGAPDPAGGSVAPVRLYRPGGGRLGATPSEAGIQWCSPRGLSTQCPARPGAGYWLIHSAPPRARSWSAVWCTTTNSSTICRRRARRAGRLECWPAAGPCASANPLKCETTADARRCSPGGRDDRLPADDELLGSVRLTNPTASDESDRPL